MAILWEVGSLTPPPRACTEIVAPDPGSVPNAVLDEAPQEVRDGTYRGSALAVSWLPTFAWDNEAWRDRAACRDTHSELFFPAGSTGEAVDQIEAAKAVCRSCPVHAACLDFALESNQESGIWGGKDEEERRRLRKVWRVGRRSPLRSATG